MIRTTIAATLLGITAAAFAQKPAPAPTSTSTTAATIEADSRQTREDLTEILRRYPPQVPQVLKLDPTLFANNSYMANYPALATFVTQHPEVAHNPEFFLQRFPDPDANPNPGGYRMWRDILSDIGGFTAFLVVVSVLIWAIRTLIEQRRWSRMVKMQTDVHSKLLDRFTSNEELMAYIQTPTGRRFLESAPITLEPGPRPISAPIGRIFWSLQAGLVAVALGVGLDIVSLRAQRESAEVLYGLGMIALLIGIALVISSIVFYTLSRKFGLWTPPPPAAHEAE